MSLIKAATCASYLRRLSFEIVLLAILPFSSLYGKCPTPPPPVPAISKEKVYDKLPYKAGEISKYELYWTKLKAGYLTLQVLDPIKENGNWYQVYGFDAATGDWFKHIYIGRYQGKGFVRPFDNGIAKFRLSTYRDPPFESAYKEDKWIQFDQENCEVQETIKAGDKPIIKKNLELEYGANDALGVFFRLRTFNYQIGKSERILVYSSEKNWWLEAIPQTVEKIKVPFGEFEATKLKLLTYIGKDLQQKGDVYAWVAKDHPQRPLLQIEAAVKIGSVRIILESIQN